MPRRHASAVVPLARHLRQTLLNLRHLQIRSRLHLLRRRLLSVILGRGELVSGTPESSLKLRRTELALEIIDLRLENDDFGVPWFGPHDGGDQKRKRAED
jgi:hypothetical protein